MGGLIDSNKDIILVGNTGISVEDLSDKDKQLHLIWGLHIFKDL